MKKVSPQEDKCVRVVLKIYKVAQGKKIARYTTSPRGCEGRLYNNGNDYESHCRGCFVVFLII